MGQQEGFEGRQEEMKTVQNNDWVMLVDDDKRVSFRVKDGTTGNIKAQGYISIPYELWCDFLNLVEDANRLIR